MDLFSVFFLLFLPPPSSHPSLFCSLLLFLLPPSIHSLATTITISFSSFFSSSFSSSILTFQQQQPRPCLFHFVHLLFSNKTQFSIIKSKFNSNNVFPPQFVVLVLLKPLFLHGFSLNYYKIIVFKSLNFY